jgi:hypothetical protein
MKNMINVSLMYPSRQHIPLLGKLSNKLTKVSTFMEIKYNGETNGMRENEVLTG